jgi:phosphoglycerate kinase
MPHHYRSLRTADIRSKRVLVRAGFDVPMEDGHVTDDTRIVALVPTMRYILDGGGSIVLMAHQGRPKDAPDPEFSQKPLVVVLEKLLKTTVHFAPSCTGEETQRMAAALKPGDVLLLENLRFDPREKKNDPAFAKELATLGDVYVNDAFTNCHREHASMVALAKELPAFMGLQLEQEVTHLEPVLHDAARPVTLIISGAKMETKIPVIRTFLTHGQHILTGGCIANTFLAATGVNVGPSKHEPQRLEECRAMLADAGKADAATIHMPQDAVTAHAPDDAHPIPNVSVDALDGSAAIFDPGAATTKVYARIIAASKTIVWNGPLGMYEREEFSHASTGIAAAIAKATTAGAMTVIGGGDTIDLHIRYGLSLDAYTFVSTGGGAMLEFLAGEKFASLEALKEE